MGDPELLQSVPPEQYPYGVIARLPRYTSIKAQVALHQYYDFVFGLYDHRHSQPDRPFALNEHFPQEDYTENWYYPRWREYIDNDVGDTTRLSWREFIELPTCHLEELVRFCAEEKVQKIRRKAQESVEMERFIAEFRKRPTGP